MNLNFSDIIKTIVNMLGGNKQVARNIEDLTKGMEDQKKRVKTPEVNTGSLTVNGHTYAVKKSGKSVLVSFTNVPSDAEEFAHIYNKLLGKSEYTVPALIPMAMEIYARNRQDGEKCIETFCNYAAKQEMKRTLMDKFGRQDSSYGQRYLPAALLQGANNRNAYAPDCPYTVCIEHTPKEDEESDMYNGTFYNLVIVADGWDSRERNVQVFKPFDKEMFLVNGCPATYMQCKPIRGTWGGLR